MDIDMNQKILEKAVSLYCGETVLQRVLELGEKAFDLEVESKEMTLLGVDIKSFTKLEKSPSLKAIVDLHNIYLNKMSRILIEHGATIDHYQGSFILAYWSTIAKSDTIKSVHAGMELLKSSESIKSDVTKLGLSDFQLKIGINSGTVLQGNFGTSSRLNYTLFGDHVNYLHRIVGANDHFDTNILLANFTRDILTEEFDFQKIKDFQIKGKSGAFSVYTINTTPNIAM